jgi:hypothetical protein
LVVLGSSLTAIACGQSAQGPSRESDVKKALDTFHRAAADGDGRRVCALMTAEGRKALLEQRGQHDCVKAFTFSGEKKQRRLPPIGPIGAENGEALAVVHVIGPREENYVYALKMADGRWLVDFPGPIPLPHTLEGDAASSRTVLDTANRYQKALESGDGKTACSLLLPAAARHQGRSYRPPRDSPRPRGESPCEFAVDTGLFASDSPPAFDEATAVGDIALAYSNSNLHFLIKTAAGWRVSNMQLGVP